MRAQISNNGSNTTWAENKTVAGILFCIEATGELTYDPTAVQVNVQISREGRSFTPVAGNLYAIAKGWDPANAELQSMTADTLTWQGAYVSFGKVPINLRGNDRLTVSVSVAGSVNATTTFTIIEGEGVEFYTPTVNVYPVNINQTKQTFMLGANVTKVTILQSGNEFGITAANLNTDLFDANLTLPDLKALAAIQRQGVTSSSITDRVSCVIYDGHPTKNAELDVTIDTNQTGPFFVVVFGGENRSRAGRIDAESTVSNVIQANIDKYGAVPFNNLNSVKNRN